MEPITAVVPEPPVLAQTPIDQRVFDLYDEYCHGGIDRREFLRRASALTIGGISALAMAQSPSPRYAQAQTISFTDTRMKARYVEYPSPGGNSGACAPIWSSRRAAARFRRSWCSTRIAA